MEVRRGCYCRLVYEWASSKTARFYIERKAVHPLCPVDSFPLRPLQRWPHKASRPPGARSQCSEVNSQGLVLKHSFVACATGEWKQITASALWHGQ